ncbi:MAG: cupin domain-containing protein, partial [Sciscionella sp.]
MTTPSYYVPEGGLPGQTELLTDRAVVTEAYTVIPRGVLRDIVVSVLPGWRDTRTWVLGRPVAGGATTFAQYLVEVAPGGGSREPEPEAAVESFVFLLSGRLRVTLDGTTHDLTAGGFAFVPPAAHWQVENAGDELAVFQWIRKAHEPLTGHTPQPVVGNEQQIEATAMPDTDGRWSTTRMLPPDDLAYDMH